MRYAVTNEIIAMRLSEGEELNRSISQICEENAIDSAVVLAAAGFVRNVTFGWFTGKEYLMETHNEIFELLFLNGDVSSKEGVPRPVSPGKVLPPPSPLFLCPLVPRRSSRGVRRELRGKRRGRFRQRPKRFPGKKGPRPGMF